MTINAAVLDMLVRLAWLNGDDTTNPAAVGRAITELLAGAAMKI